MASSEESVGHLYVEWQPEAQLAQPANPMPDKRSFSFLLFRSQLPFEQFAFPRPKGTNAWHGIEDGRLNGAFRHS